jgi:hypothetical protein
MIIWKRYIVLYMVSTSLWASLTSNNLPLTAVGSNPDRDFGFIFVRKHTASLRNVGASTQVPVRAWKMHGTAPEVWNVAIWPILCRCDVKPKTNKQNLHHLWDSSWFGYLGQLQFSGDVGGQGFTLSDLKIKGKSVFPLAYNVICYFQGRLFYLT